MTYDPRPAYRGLLTCALPFALKTLMRPTPASFALLLFLAPQAFAQDAAAPASNAPITLAQAMADPDWIGAPIESAWWSWDGAARVHAAQAHGRDDPRHVACSRSPAARPRSSMAPRAPTPTPTAPAYDTQRTRMAFVRNGDVFVRDLRSGALQQLTRTNDDESQPQWGSDGGLSWRVGNDWYRWTSGRRRAPGRDRARREVARHQARGRRPA